MRKTNNLDQWAAMERMRFIERSAYWRGIVNRQDLAEVFGLSLAQASADLQEYQRLNPGALAYNLNRKRYEGTPTMRLIYTEAVLEEAMALFLSGGGEARAAATMEGVRMPKASELPQVYFIKVPSRRPSADVERRVFMAVLHGLRIRVKYYSRNSGTLDWRWLQPSAFCHNGSRWHVRAWCEKRDEWRDFTLSRIEAADVPIPAVTTDMVDEERLNKVSLRLRAAISRDNPGAEKAVEQDFGMENGEITIEANQATEDYLRARLRLPLADGSMPEPLVEEVK